MGLTTLPCRTMPRKCWVHVRYVRRGTLNEKGEVGSGKKDAKKEQKEYFCDSIVRFDRIMVGKRDTGLSVHLCFETGEAKKDKKTMIFADTEQREDFVEVSRWTLRVMMNHTAHTAVHQSICSYEENQES